MSKQTTNQIVYESHPKMFKNNPILVILSLFLVIPGIPSFAISFDSFFLNTPMLGALILAVLWLKSKGTKLILTKEKAILRTGILSKNENEVFHADVRNIKVSQSMIQRLLKIGSVEISTAGQSDIEVSINGIPEPGKVKSIINQYRK